MDARWPDGRRRSVIAEVYTLNACFIAALLWLALRWARRPFLPVEPSPRW